MLKCFVAKSLYNIPQTKSFIDYLESCPILRRLCGFESVGEIPSEATFSRAFQELAKFDIAGRIHEAMTHKHFRDHLFCHVSRDSSAIVAREKPVKKEKEIKPKLKKGRPKKGEKSPRKEPRRLEQQIQRDLDANLRDLPTDCNHGSKKDSKGNIMHWIGYKLHCDVVDGDIPVSAVVTSASLHDSQAAIPLAQMTDQRVNTLYDLMDAAYDAPEIHDLSRKLGHVPIIDDNPRKGIKKEKDLSNPLLKKKKDSFLEKGFSNE
ncbi:MAG: transposase [Nitrosopumilaceae archaeon]|nr:transposase [Nitrosopumilaceae archaeon]NIX62324.1 transposase [Nitrosopumilaceae archaeon]